MEYITLELRPRLQTCNAFIHLRESACSKEVDIELSEESIILRIGKDRINLLTKSVKLIPTSISALNVTNDWIYFRVQTRSEPVFGSFKTEVVTDSRPRNNFLKSISNNKLLKTTDYVVSCTCCKNSICEKAYFKRILPLPDIDYDLSEWFCCKHSCNDVVKDLSPEESDLFYGPIFSILHKNLFNSNVKIDDNTIICNRCLQCLGKLYGSNALKLWNCCVDYNLLNYKTTETATDPLADFFLAVKTSVTGIFGEEIILQSFMKNETHYLAIKPMDWHLSLITEPKVIHNNNIISLQKISVVKVLYKYGTSESINDCTNIKYCEVGLPVIEAGLKYLLLSTKRFPKHHRVAADYYIGHIHLEESTNET